MGKEQGVKLGREESPSGQDGGREQSPQRQAREWSKVKAMSIRAREQRDQQGLDYGGF